MRIYKIFTSKYLALFLLTLLFSGKLIAQTTITSSITIDQAWVNTKPTPWTISGTVTVTFGENFTITNTNQYFIISGTNVIIIDGAGKTATISGVTNYKGLVDASASNASTAQIKNIGVLTQGNSTLEGNVISSIKGGGWISQASNRANISNCYSTGAISSACGGIVGESNIGSIINCYTTGAISGVASGGIAGYQNSGAISHCYSSGAISGSYAGGIAALINSGSITDSRSSGSMTGSRAKFIADFGTFINSSERTPTVANTWDNSIANQALTGVGTTVWNTSNTPYTLMSFLLSELTISLPGASLTSCSGSSSTQTTFGVSGSGLTESVTISAPSGFEISTSEDGSYSSSITLTNTSTVSKTLHVRLSYSETIGTISGSITATSSSTTATTTVSGTVNAIPSISISETDASDVLDDAIICARSSVTLTASGTAAAYLWSISTSSATITPSPSTTTTYTVTGTTSGCSNTASITITVNALPSVNITVIDASGAANNDAIICEGSSVTLTASGTTAAYLWSTSDINSSITPSPSTTTTYTVTGTTSGCSNTASLTVTVNAIPSVNITVIDASGVNPNDAIICAGSSVTLTASGTTASYLWSTSTNSATITPSPSTNTTYTVTGTTSGCSNTASVTVTVNAIPTVNITVIDASGVNPNDAIICAGSSVTLTASGTTASYLWSTSDINSSITPSPSTNTTYTVTGTTSGCSNTASMTVTVNAIPTISISESDASGSDDNDRKICKDGIATLTASETAAEYLWSTSDDSISITPSPSSNTTYTVTGTTSGCSNTASITITVESLPTLSFNSITLCNESTYLITNTTSLPNNESWSVSGNINFNNGYLTAGTIPGAYTVSYTDGCAQTVSATVNVAPTSILPAITDGQASYKFDGTPKGPSSASYFVGYNGFSYSSPNKPTNTGYYKANNQSGSEAGCPYTFYIFRCTTCSDVPPPPPPPGPPAPTPRP